jgi:hypothetical protein
MLYFQLKGGRKEKVGASNIKRVEDIWKPLFPYAFNIVYFYKFVSAYFHKFFNNSLRKKPIAYIKTISFYFIFLL